MSDPNDYAADAGYVLNDQGNYVNGSSSGSDFVFDSSSGFGQEPVSWDSYVPDDSYNAVAGGGEWGEPVNNVEQGSWWDQAQQNLGGWWDQTTQDAGNWLSDNNVNLTNGVGDFSGINLETGYVAPGFSSVSDSPDQSAGWDWRNWDTWNPDNAINSGKQGFNDFLNTTTQVGAEVDKFLDAPFGAKISSDFEQSELASIYDSQKGQFGGGWEAQLGLKPIVLLNEDGSYGVVSQGAAPAVGESSWTLGSGWLTSGVSEWAPAIALGIGIGGGAIAANSKNISAPSVAVSGTIISAPTGLGGINAGSYITLRQGTPDSQIFLVNKVERDPKTGEITSVNVTNTNLPKDSMSFQGGDIIDEARKIDKIAASIVSPPTSVDGARTLPSVVVPLVVPPSSTSGSGPVTDMSNKTADQIRNWGVSEYGYGDPRNTANSFNDYLKVVDNAFVVDYGTGRIVGVKDYVNGVPRELLYSNLDKMNRQDRDLTLHTKSWVDGFNHGLTVGEVDKGQSLRTALATGRGGGNSSPYYNTATGNATGLGEAIGLKTDEQLRGSVLNDPSHTTGGNHSNSEWIKVGNYNVYTQDSKTMSNEVQEAIQLTETEHPGFMRAINEFGGWDHVSGAPFTAKTLNSERIPTQFLYTSEGASADTHANALFGTRAFGGTFTPGGGFKTVLPNLQFLPLAGAGGGESKQNFYPSTFWRANFSGKKEPNTGEWQDYRTMILQGEGLKYGQDVTGDVLTGAAADNRRAIIENVGNKLAQEEGDSKMFAVLSAIHTGASPKDNPSGSNPLTTEMLHKALLNTRNNEALYQGLTGGAGRQVDSMVRNPTPVDVDEATGKVEFVPWTWDRYFTPSGVEENTSDKYVPPEVQGMRQQRYQSPFSGQITEPSITTTYGRGGPNLSVIRAVGPFGNIINDMGEGTNTGRNITIVGTGTATGTIGPVDFNVFQRRPDYSRIGFSPSAVVTGKESTPTEQILETSWTKTVNGIDYVVTPLTGGGYTFTKFETDHGADSYLDRVYPGWGNCGNGTCKVNNVQDQDIFNQIVQDNQKKKNHVRKIVKKNMGNNKNRKSISC